MVLATALRILYFTGIICLTLSLATESMAGSSVRPSQGTLLGGASGSERSPMPLRRTTVRARVSAASAHVHVSQEFVNPFPESIEAVYVFPLPANSAVVGTHIEVGERRIDGRVVARRRARDAYLEAQASGQRAVTVDMERANIFTQSVSNVPPGGKVVVHLDYHAPLSLRSGTYEFTFPMVVAPRSIPGSPDGVVPSGGGRLPDTERVKDASRITPPLLAGGLRSGRDVQVSIIIDEGQELSWVKSPSHAIRTRALGKGRFEVSLAKRREIPNRDLRVRYRPKQLVPAISLHREKDGSGFLGLTIPYPSVAGQREDPVSVVWLVDDSASVGKATLGAIRRLVMDVSSRLPASTKTGLALLSGRAGLANEENSKDHRIRLAARLAALAPTTITDPVPGMRKALGRLRRGGTLVFASDGWFGNEHELAKLSAAAKDTRIVPVMIGSAPNRYMGDLVAAAGRGTTLELAPGEGSGRAAAELTALLTRPSLAARVRWPSGLFHSITPVNHSQVAPGRALRLFARFDTLPGSASVEVTYAGQSSVLDISGAGARSNPSLRFLWARYRLADIELDAVVTGADNSAEVEALGTQFGLITARTSFLALDTAKGERGPNTTIAVPVQVPAWTNRSQVLSDSAISDDTETEEGLREKAPALDVGSSLEAGRTEFATVARELGSYRFSAALSVGSVWASGDAAAAVRSSVRLRTPLFQRLALVSELDMMLSLDSSAPSMLALVEKMSLALWGGLDIAPGVGLGLDSSRNLAGLIGVDLSIPLTTRLGVEGRYHHVLVHDRADFDVVTVGIFLRF